MLQGCQQLITDNYADFTASVNPLRMSAKIDNHSLRIVFLLELILGLHSLLLRINSIETSEQGLKLLYSKCGVKCKLFDRCNLSSIITGLRIFPKIDAWRYVFADEKDIMEICDSCDWFDKEIQKGLCVFMFVCVFICVFF